MADLNSTLVRGKLRVTEDEVVSGNVSATTFTGSGANLTNLNGSNISSGTVPGARLPAGSTSQAGIVQLAGTGSATTVAKSDHTHTTAIRNSGDTTDVTNLAANTSYILKTGGTTYTFKTPADSNYYPTAFSWTNGTTSGPTGSLTGTGMSAVSFGAIPSASDTKSGVVTTDLQSFSGQKTFLGGIAFYDAEADLPYNVSIYDDVLHVSASSRCSLSYDIYNAIINVTPYSDTTYSLNLPRSTGTLATIESISGYPAYSSSSTYDLGSKVIYDGKLYRCTTAITTAESWNPAHWTEVCLSTDYVDTFSAQTINGAKTFNTNPVISGINKVYNNTTYTVASFYYDEYGSRLHTNGHLSVYGDDDGNDSRKPTNNTGFSDLDTIYYNTGITLYENGEDAYKLSFPAKSGTFATTDDITVTGATDGMFDLSVSNKNISVAPYSATTATSTWVSNDNNAGKFYLGNQNPSKITRLNYNGYIYAKKLYSGGNEVLTSYSETDTLASVTGRGATTSTAVTMSGGLDVTGNNLKLNKISAPTSSGGSTYGTGSSGQVLKANGSGTVYWASDNNANYYAKTDFSSMAAANKYKIATGYSGTSASSTYDLYVPYASGSQAGLVGNLDQTFYGQKTFSQSDDTPIESVTLLVENAFFTVHDIVNDSVRAYFYADDLTDERSFSLPDASGTLALTDNITVTGATDGMFDLSVSNKNISVAPYDATTATSTWVTNSANAGKFYLGNVNPNYNNRLNYNGGLFARSFIAKNVVNNMSLNTWIDTGGVYFEQPLTSEQAYGGIHLSKSPVASEISAIKINSYSDTDDSNENYGNLYITNDGGIPKKLRFIWNTNYYDSDNDEYIDENYIFTFPHSSGNIPTVEFFAPLYSSGITYSTGDKVNYNGYLYRYKYNTSASNILPTNSTYWEIINSSKQRAIAVMNDLPQVIDLRS